MCDIQCNKKGENWDSPNKGGEWIGDIILGDIISWNKKGTDDLI